MTINFWTMFYPACLTYLFYVHVGCRLEFHYGEDLDKDNYQLMSIKKKYITYCQCPSGGETTKLIKAQHKCQSQKNSHHPGKDGDSLKKIGLWILSHNPGNIHVKVYDNAHPCRKQEHLKICVKCWWRSILLRLCKTKGFSTDHFAMEIFACFFKNNSKVA